MTFLNTRWTLIDAAKRGEQSAFEELLEHYGPPVRRYLATCGVSSADVEDLTQEVFLRLYKSVLPGAEAQLGRFRSLVVAVAKNVALEHFRRARALKRGGEVEHVPLEEELVGSLQPESVFDREWLAHLLSRGLERLEQEHPTYHAALCATALEKQTYAQCAEALGITETDVRNRVYRGKQRLSRYLRAEVKAYAASPEEHATEVALLNRLLGG